MTTARPELSANPIKCSVERDMRVPPHNVYLAWTEQFDRWFAAPGTVLMQARVDAPFFFETHYQGQRHAHYGRFLKLDPDRLVELTWVTGAAGTEGAETIVKVEIAPSRKGSAVRLTHSGFPSEEAMRRHDGAWAQVLEQQENALKSDHD